MTHRPPSPAAAVALAGLAASALLPRAGAAQTTAVAVAQGAGWIGVRAEERYNCGWETSDAWKNCTLVVRIREMQEDGPAARAGLLTGDLLTAVNGALLTTENLADLLSSIRPGVAVRLNVARGGESHAFEVVPDRRPPQADDMPMVGRATVVATSEDPQPNTFVVRLTNPAADEREESGFALTFRDTETAGVAVEPTAVRVVDGRLSVLRLRGLPVAELPSFRLEVLNDLERATESAYRNSTAALQRVGAVQARPPHGAGGPAGADRSRACGPLS